ncbi:putative bifunctional diguanylate cyclase/phosphodiesterase [Alteriqipengyuania sp. 357]
MSKLAHNPLLRRGGLLYKLLYLRLVDHQPESKDREWWARCRIEHVCTTPYFIYDIVRTGVAAIIFLSFMPLFFVAAMAVTGLAIAAGQIAVDLRVKTQKRPHSETFAKVKRLVILRSLHWALFSGIALYCATPDLLVALVPMAVMMMWIEAIALIAVPGRAMANAAINALAIAIPLTLSGSDAAFGGALVSIASFFGLHWLVFNLNYMFATRRLRTRNLSDANDTIQLLLNQYDEDGSDWLFECTEEGYILRPSRRFCEAAGRTARQLEGMQLLDLFYDSPERDELRKMGGQDENFRRLVVPLQVRQQQRWWSISARKVTSIDGTRRYWRGFVADVTRAREAEAKVSYMAHYDVLTGLPNRALFNNRLAHAFERRGKDQMVAVLGIDLDHFKDINDTFGHAGGDAALREAARRLERSVPKGAVVARLGGDEFAVLIERPASRETAIACAHAIVDAVGQPIELRGQRAALGASVGVAFAPHHGTRSEDVILAADLALYDAKASGRNAASVFDRQMQQRVQERRQLEIDLRDALANGELELHYQPLVDTQSGEPVGYEALLRWTHPERGPIAPDVFVPIAEESGLIVQIGSWVLREALHEASRWPSHLSVSVNLSPVQTTDCGLYGAIVHALATSGVDPKRLELEITESVLLRESEETAALLHKVRALGVRIALDDFGMGYSSLNYLRAFPFDKIKIDRCFVADMTQREENETIVQAVIALAARLNMKTTAEGIETAEQLAMIRATECDQVQGFYFSGAVPADELQHTCSLPVSEGAKITRLRSGTPGASEDQATGVTRSGKSAPDRAIRRRLG